MKITFFGAAGEVTGSCSMLESGHHRVLVDCGMFQGSEDMDHKNREELPFDAATLTSVLVTHAHLDHVGRLPLLAKNGYKGFVYATPPTRELTQLILEDAYSVMEYESRHFNKPLLYTLDDIGHIMSRFKTVTYGTKVLFEKYPTTLFEHVDKLFRSKKKKNALAENEADSFQFHDAGHIFGSAFIEMTVENKKVVFSGDVGNVGVPILRDTEKLPRNLDLLVCESTYGDRNHESSLERESLIESLVQEAMHTGGVLMIPSFALERTQELLYELTDLVERHKTISRVPIFLDSPLAIDALKVFEKYPEYYDEEASNFFKNGEDLFEFPGLVQTYSRTDSMKINHTPAPKIVIAGAGMMNGGRILHHALRYLSDPRNTLLLVGYQSPGTLGWRLAHGESPVKIHDEKVIVRCRIKVISALSAHADEEKLFNWINNDGYLPQRVILNHGEEKSAQVLADRLVKEKGIQTSVAKQHMVTEL